MPSLEQIQLLGVLAASRDIDWNFVAREAQRLDGLARLLSGQATETGPEAQENILHLRQALAAHKAGMEEAAKRVELAEQHGARLSTVLDDDYPQNLREIPNLPPFLFYKGRLEPADSYAVAVIGTRNASREGLIRAGRMATLLVERGVTVLSGLALGIDTVAHTATLEAGGRTVAVMGTGVCHTYPAENEALAERIVASGGLLVSQFWPGQFPAKYTFPRRNVVMSGMGQGSVVIEASATSGAKMQARLALEHHRKVFLLRSLVEEYEWARNYSSRTGAVVVETVDDVVRELRPCGQGSRFIDRSVQLRLLG